jgi:hypothetical protein
VVEHKEPHEVIAATTAVLARIDELARRAGIRDLPPLVDAEFTIVPEGANQ